MNYLLLLIFFLQEELESLRAKVEKLESERTALKHENDKLEAKVSPRIIFMTVNEKHLIPSLILIINQRN